MRRQARFPLCERWLCDRTTAAESVTADSTGSESAVVRLLGVLEDPDKAKRFAEEERTGFEAALRAAKTGSRHTAADTGKPGSGLP